MEVMEEGIQIQEMNEKERDQVFELVKTGFNEFVKQDLSEDGETEFFRALREFVYTRPDNHFILVARIDDKVIGMIDVRDNNHICLFFVAKEFQSKHIGRKLFEEAISRCITKRPKNTEIEVNSSTFAIDIYRKLGFIQLDKEQMVNGIKFVPMSKTIC